MKTFLPFTRKSLLPAMVARVVQVLVLIASTLLLPAAKAKAGQIPTTLQLSISHIHENNTIGQVVGTFAADPQSGVCTYSLVEGADDTDNAYFTITGNALKAKAVFDYEVKENYFIRVRCTDGSGGALEKSFLILVVDVYEVTNSVEATNLVTPNGDGKNDTWIIRNLPAHGNNEVRILDRSGRVVYYKKNYSNDWDGRLTNGELLAEGVYFYVIDFGAGLNLFKGTITLIRDRR